MRQCGEFRKIYQPLNPDKAFRFFYDGVKPRDFINGLAELKIGYEKYLKQLEKEEEEDFDPEKTPDTKKPKKPNKLEAAVFCSGECDAMNVAGMGYYPLWLNSETAKLQKKDFAEIAKMVEKVYNIPDIDETGIKKGNEFALDHIDAFSIEIPQWLRNYKDNRGKPRKDVHDFVEIRPQKYDFDMMVKSANSCRFWEKSYTKEGVKWEINTKHLLHFLKVNGFGKITDVESGKITYIVAVKIFEDKIEEKRGGDTGTKTWDKDIVKHHYKRLDPAFSTVIDPETREVRLSIYHIKSHYFRFLINGSRIFWRKEFEYRKDVDTDKEFLSKYKWAIASPRLTEEEVEEQQKHLLNKMYTIGYLLHRYKSYSNGLAVWIMENKPTEEDESSGGSGKSLMLKFLGNMCRMVTLDGRNQKLTDAQFYLDRVDEYTDILRIDDAHRYFDFNAFYSMITDSMVVNAKQLKSKEIRYEDSAKIAISSNSPRSSDSSTMRRMLMSVFSDYYHKATDENDYLETRTIADDFGYDIHDGLYKEEWWNEDVNFCIDCIQFYLSASRQGIIIQPPMENVHKRINIHQMGDEFLAWANVYFAPESENLNVLLEKSLVKDNFDPKKKMS